MSGSLQKLVLIPLAGALLVGASFAQRALNVERGLLGLTRAAPLENAPPMLAFTTVALGGFRGLISNALWMRATELQDQDKFFEMVQLADWITKLEPHFAQVWAVQAWNMAYNISVKFKESAPGEFPDRWRWVQRGIELLRDDGLRYNPNEVLLYRELGWFFQHKMGANLDDAHMYYKEKWAEEMGKVLGDGRPDFDALIQPQTEEQKERARLLREKYKMDPALMKEIDEKYGPLEWRLPEASAIYWASVGLKRARDLPAKVNQQDLLMLRRMVWQSLLLDLHRGKLNLNPFGTGIQLSPNLDIISNLNDAFEQGIKDEPDKKDIIQNAQRNALRDAVFYLYEYNRRNEAERWYKFIADHFPEKNLIDGKPDSLPATMTCDQFALARIEEVVGESDPVAMRGLIGGLLEGSYTSLVFPGGESRYTGMRLLARKVYDDFSARLAGIDRNKLPPFAEIDREVWGSLANATNGLPPAVREAIRSKMPAGALASASTNSPAGTTTNPPAGRPNGGK